MFHNSYDKAQFELIGGKLAADTMMDRVTPLGLSVLGLLWTLGKSKKSEV